MKQSVPRRGDALELRITLRGTEPEVWRSLTLPADLTFGDLHAVLQVVFAWENSHLHEFVAGDITFGMLDEESLSFSVYEGAAPLGAVLHPKLKVIYRYDFGDEWVHEIAMKRLIQGGADEGITCLGGERASPPEDCGGVSGFEELLRVLADPEDPEYRERRSWVGKKYDPEKFDLAAMNRKLKALTREIRLARPKRR